MLLIVCECSVLVGCVGCAFRMFDQVYQTNNNPHDLCPVTKET